MAHVKADHATDRARHFFIVAGQDLDLNAVFMERFDGVFCSQFRRIKEGEVTDEHHLSFIFYGEHADGGGVCFLRDQKNAQSFFIVFVNILSHFFDDPFIERDHAIVINLSELTHLEHFLQGALGDHLRLAGFVTDHDTHAPALKVKGDLVDFLVAIAQLAERVRFVLLLLMCLFNNGPIHEVAKAGLEIGVEISVTQDANIFLTCQIEVVLKRDAVLRDGACFIRTKDVNRAQILDGVQVFDNDLLLRHMDGSLGQTGRHNHGQHLGGETHRQGDGQ